MWVCGHGQMLQKSAVWTAFMAHCARDAHCCVLRVGDARGGCIPIAGQIGYEAPSAPSWAAFGSSGGGALSHSSAALRSVSGDDGDVFESDRVAYQRDDDDVAALGLDASDLQHFFGDP